MDLFAREENRGTQRLFSCLDQATRFELLPIAYRLLYPSLWYIPKDSLCRVKDTEKRDGWNRPEQRESWREVIGMT